MNHEPQSSGLRLKIDFAQASDPGRDPNKQVNEDSCGYAETRFGHLAVLCDGMGGHYGGKEASRTAITTIFEMFEQMPAGTSGAQTLKLAIEEAGRRVYQLGGPPDNRARPGSTVVAMLLSDRGLDVAHVGDSRAYIIRSNQIYPLTRDHSMVQGMIDAGMLTEETAMGHPDSNKITRALGMRPDVEVELRPETMEVFTGDLLLQSSDGLTDLALGRDILGCARQALASGGVENACNMLVRLANDRGGHDNITVQIVRVADVGAKVRTTIPEQPAGAPRSNPGVPATAAMSALPGMGAAPAGQDGGRPHAPGAYPAQATAAPGAWAPSAATMRGVGGAQPAGAPESRKPTLNDTAYAPPQATQAYGSAPQAAAGPANWAATAYQPAGATPAPVSAGAAGGPGLAGYRDGATAALPLPPAGMPGYGSPLTPTPPPVNFTPSPTGFGVQGGPNNGLAQAPMNPYGQPVSGAPAGLSVSRGGIVFVILGLSGVIAVLILVLVWVVWLRG